MDYKVIERDSFRVVGVRRTTPQAGGTWAIVKTDGSVEKMRALAGSDFISLGLCFGFDSAGHKDYMCGFESARAAYSGFDQYIYPPGAWLVFEARGAISENVLGKTWNRIYGEFMPQSEYRQIDLPTIEKYLLWDEAADRCQVEIMIPVKNQLLKP